VRSSVPVQLYIKFPSHPDGIAVHVIDSSVNADEAEGEQVTVTGDTGGGGHHRGCAISQLGTKESSHVTIGQERSPDARTKQFSVATISDMGNSLIMGGK
jgi:hypothetical protein